MSKNTEFGHSCTTFIGYGSRVIIDTSCVPDSDTIETAVFIDGLYPERPVLSLVRRASHGANAVENHKTAFNDVVAARNNPQKLRERLKEHYFN